MCADYDKVKVVDLHRVKPRGTADQPRTWRYRPSGTKGDRNEPRSSSVWASGVLCKVKLTDKGQIAQRKDGVNWWGVVQKELGEYDADERIADESDEEDSSEHE